MLWQNRTEVLLKFSLLKVYVHYYFLISSLDYLFFSDLDNIGVRYCDIMFNYVPVSAIKLGIDIIWKNTLSSLFFLLDILHNLLLTIVELWKMIYWLSHNYLIPISLVFFSSVFEFKTFQSE